MPLICPTSQASLPAAYWHDGQISRCYASLVFAVVKRRGEKAGLLRRLLQVRDEVGAVVGVRHAGIGHAVGWDDGLRIGDVLVECLWRPGDAAAFHGGG